MYQNKLGNITYKYFRFQGRSCDKKDTPLVYLGSTLCTHVLIAADPTDGERTTFLKNCIFPKQQTICPNYHFLKTFFCSGLSLTRHQEGKLFWNFQLKTAKASRDITSYSYQLQVANVQRLTQKGHGCLLRRGNQGKSAVLLQIS